MSRTHFRQSLRRTVRRLGYPVAAVLTAALACLGVGAPADAQPTHAHATSTPAASTSENRPPDTTKSVDVRQVRDGATITVHIEFDKPVPREKAAKLAGRKGTGNGVGPSQRLRAVPNGTTTVLHCGEPTVLSTGKGSLHLRHACGTSAVRWGYRINAGLQKVIVSKVHETGMKYTHAGRTKTGKAHTAGKAHYFTGKMSPARSGSIGKYRDSLKFVTDYGLGGISHTTISVHGTFNISG